MKTIRYVLPIIPVSEDSIHDNFYEYVHSVLRCAANYDYHRDVFTLSNKKTEIRMKLSADEESLEILITSRKIFKGKWEKQLIKVLDQFVEDYDLITRSSPS